jgi:hypothetical protein
LAARGRVFVPLLVLAQQGLLALLALPVLPVLAQQGLLAPANWRQR